MAFIYDMEDTWNDAGVVFNAIRMSVTDTTAAAASQLLIILRNGVSIFSLSRTGAFLFSVGGQVNGGQFGFVNQIANGFWSICAGGNGGISYGNGNLIVWSASGISNVTNDVRGTGDVGLARNGVGVLEVNDSNLGVLTTIYVRNLRTLPMTFASLQTAASVGNGGRAFITDGALTVFNTTAAGGGTNNVPVFSDGTQWRYG